MSGGMCICRVPAISAESADRFCFFFKQKTAYEMRISDWSSDVCSSDLAKAAGGILDQGEHREETHDDEHRHEDRVLLGFLDRVAHRTDRRIQRAIKQEAQREIQQEHEIGRAHV